MEIDAIEIVHLLNHKEKDLTELSHFIEEAQALALKCNVESFSHVPGEYNKMAHSLARRACNNKEFEVWSNAYPNWLPSWGCDWFCFGSCALHL